jgi:aspartate-semialdehyde dehydrogenase
MSVRVGITGATGAVGQRLVELLAPHPEFEIAAVTASESSAGKLYRDAATWRLESPLPDRIGDLTVGSTDPGAIPGDVSLVFSSLPSDVGADVEPELARAGYVVSSNSSNARMADDVPLVIPEVNHDHLGLLEVQRDERGWDGALLKNPNCSTITFVPTLAALEDWGLRRVHVATLQAVTGAGYTGVASPDILDNAIPHIGGEEGKLETESRKLLGEFDGSAVLDHDVRVGASCNRIPTIDGHLENVWVETADDLGPEAAAEAMRQYPSLDLRNSPDRLVHVFDDPKRPQPRLDRNLECGMAIAAGGLRESTFGLQYNCLAHNTLRGAAGASVLNGELLLEEGYL